MKILKLVSVLIPLLLCCLLLSAAAYAETGPVDPYFAQTRPFAMNRRYSSEPSDLTVTLSIPENITTGTEVTFTASVTGGSGEYTYAFQIYSFDYYDEATNTNYLKTHFTHHPEDAGNYVSSNSLSYTFWYPDTYIVRVNVRDSNGLTGQYPSGYEFNVTVTGEDLLTAKVNEIISACPAGGEYEKALWLHDYLTNHACYDYKYTSYTEVGVLMFGTGVCDSYSRAYNILLDRVGIGHARVESETHAWNAVQMEGDWYHIDPTWDDPGSATVPVSGRENHEYFGLPTDIISRISHHVPTNSFPLCTAYECNYSIRNEDLPWQRSVEENIISMLDTGERDLTLTLPEKYSDSQYIYTMSDPVLNYGLSRYILERDGLEYRNRQMDIFIDGYDFDNPLLMPIKAHYPLNHTVSVISLPASLEILEQQTLQSTSAVVIVIPEGCEKIEKFAMSDSPDLDEVHIPASVTVIDSSAFTNCKSNLLIVTTKNSPAAAFADSKGYCLEIAM